jgi:integrase
VKFGIIHHRITSIGEDTAKKQWREGVARLTRHQLTVRLARIGLLLETAEGERTGWVFEPVSLQTKLGRPVRYGRPDADWVGKVVARIGRAAGVVIETGHQAKGQARTYASAHDLRRSGTQRLLDAGVPPQVVQMVLRHASFTTTRKYYAPGDVQKAAGMLRMCLGTDSGARAEALT